MRRVGFEFTISVCERAKTVRALDRAATVIGRALSTWTKYSDCSERKVGDSFFPDLLVSGGINS
jgi:hypothetical protein